MIAYRYCFFVAFVLVLAAPGLGQPRPDLVPTIADVTVDLDATVSPGDVSEGCASATSGVDLLRFSATIHNVGSADLVLGDPECPDCLRNPGAQCGNPLFHCSPAGGHDHAHYTNYASYELVDDTSGKVVATGGKFGFCVQDFTCPPRVPRIFDCNDQGITAGCSDTYLYVLGCQYIDVTNLPGGPYTLLVGVDPLGQIEESNELNNVTMASVFISKPNRSDELMEGQRIRLESAAQVDPQPDPPKLLKVVLKGSKEFHLPERVSAPTQVGAILRVFDVGGGPAVFRFALESSGWDALGNPAAPRGYHYRGSNRPNDCRSILIKPPLVRATCQIVGARFTPVIGRLEFILSTGDQTQRYCASFGGTDVRNDTSRFYRKNARARPCGA